LATKQVETSIRHSSLEGVMPLNISGKYQFRGPHAIVVVEALCYKPEGRGLDSRFVSENIPFT
jgi:hypothetical protein